MAMELEMENNLAKGYIDAYKLACRELGQRDINEVCLNANASFNKDQDTICIDYLNRVYQINFITGRVSVRNSSEEVSVTIKVLLLHYLLNAKSKPLSGNLVSFRDLKGGAAIYYQNFLKRAVTPLIKAFSNCPQDLIRVSAKLNVIREKYGDASITIKVLPMVPVTCVIWAGDEEIPASGTVLFDDSVESYLQPEDIVYAGSLGVYELIRLKQTESAPNQL